MKVCYKTSNGQEKWDTGCLYLYENTGVDHCLRSQGSDSKYLKINWMGYGNWMCWLTITHQQKIQLKLHKNEWFCVDRKFKAVGSFLSPFLLSPALSLHHPHPYFLQGISYYLHAHSSVLLWWSLCLRLLCLSSSKSIWISRVRCWEELSAFGSVSIRTEN